GVPDALFGEGALRLALFTKLVQSDGGVDNGGAENSRPGMFQGQAGPANSLLAWALDGVLRWWEALEEPPVAPERDNAPADPLDGDMSALPPDPWSEAGEMPPALAAVRVGQVGNLPDESSRLATRPTEPGPLFDTLAVSLLFAGVGTHLNGGRDESRKSQLL